MLDKPITFTYRELITAFDLWEKAINSGSIPERPIGNTTGEMFTNYLITVVNKIRQEEKKAYNAK